MMMTIMGYGVETNGGPDVEAGRFVKKERERC